MSKLKIALIIIAVIIIVIVIGVTIFKNIVGKKLEAYNHFDYSALDLSRVADGTYTGNEDTVAIKVSVEVTVKDHKITKVTILRHDCGKGKPAEVIVNDIVKQNSVEVDAISGATYSSNIIKVAVYNALIKAEK